MKFFLPLILFNFTLFSQENIVNDYFNEIVSKNEFNDNISINKWNKNLKIYVCDFTEDSLYCKNLDYIIDSLKKELVLIVDELNGYINSISIDFVDNCDSANFFIYLGSNYWYNKSVPKSIKYTKTNLGLFIVSKTNNIITNGTMYVDLYRTKTINEMKHLLREELTQSLGFFNDSWIYPESVFYQGWTDVTKYSEMDKEVIKLLYK